MGGYFFWVPHKGGWGGDTPKYLIFLPKVAQTPYPKSQTIRNHVSYAKIRVIIISARGGPPRPILCISKPNRFQQYMCKIRRWFRRLGVGAAQSLETHFRLNMSEIWCWFGRWGASPKPRMECLKTNADLLLPQVPKLIFDYIRSKSCVAFVDWGQAPSPERYISKWT